MPNELSKDDISFLRNLELHLLYAESKNYEYSENSSIRIEATSGTLILPTKLHFVSPRSNKFASCSLWKLNKYFHHIENDLILSLKNSDSVISNEFEIYRQYSFYYISSRKDLVDRPEYDPQKIYLVKSKENISSVLNIISVLE